jgi:hypothetical protein
VIWRGACEEASKRGRGRRREKKKKKKKKNKTFGGLFYVFTI